MPQASREHHFDIFPERSTSKKLKRISLGSQQGSAWRDQLENKKVDLRAFAPQEQKKEQVEVPIKQKSSQPRTPEPILATSTDMRQKKQGTEEFAEVELPQTFDQTSRDKLLQELETIEEEHVKLQKIIVSSAVATKKIPKNEYAPWTSFENGEALSLFAPTSALSARRANLQKHGTFRRASLIPDAEYAISRPSLKKRKKGAAQGFAGSAILLMLVFGAGLWQRSQGLEGRVIPEVIQAYENLEQAKADLVALHFAQASSEFSAAEEKFSEAQDAIESVGGAFLAQAIAASPVPNKARSGIHLIVAGREFSHAGADVSHAAFLLAAANQGTPALLKTAATPAPAEASAVVKTLADKSANQQDSFSFVFSEAMRELSDAQTNITQAQSNLTDVRIEDIPREYQSQFSDALARLNDANSIFQSIGPLSDALTTFAGMQSEKTYLLLFQNPAEIRATGGFLGTYGVIKIDQGQIKSITADGVYDADGQLAVNVVPPYPVEYVSTAWSMHDANWFFDFPASAEKIIWFYEKTGGATPDGVIAITPQLVENLLQITGPIAMPAYNVALSADNFEDVVQQQVEVGYDKTQNKPKQILADLMPVLFVRMQGALSSHTGDIAQILMRNLEKKNILLYSRDQNVERVFDVQKWSGRVAAPVSHGAQDIQDVLGVVQTNLGGYKTDRVIHTAIQSETTVQLDGSIRRTVTVTRTHQGGKTMFDWYNKPNVDYMRAYVPEGSRFIQASGFSSQPAIPSFDYHANDFSTDQTIASTGLGDKKDPSSNTDIFQENGMQVFGNWLMLRPGETKTVQFEYVLPTTFVAPSSYALSLFAQAGIDPVISATLDVSQAGKIATCSQGSYDSHTMNVQKAVFNADTKIICVIGR